MSPMTMSLWMPCFLSCKSKSVLAKPLEHQCSCVTISSVTETGMHHDIKALVYVVAVQPEVGESLSDLAEKMPPAAKSIGPVGDGFLAVNPDAFPIDFAADAPKAVARFMAISQVPISGDALKAKATVV